METITNPNLKESLMDKMNTSKINHNLVERKNYASFTAENLR